MQEVIDASQQAGIFYLYAYTPLCNNSLIEMWTTSA